MRHTEITVLVINGARKRLQKNDNAKKNSAAWIEEERNNLRAYEYLCHIGEAKEYLSFIARKSTNLAVLDGSKPVFLRKLEPS